MIFLKKYLTTASLAILLSSGMFINGDNVEAASNSNIVAASTWTWYYTDYTLVDGWYEKWYINHSSGQNKKETYNASGKLIKVTYY